MDINVGREMAFNDKLSKGFTVRQEREEDFFEVEALVKRAFWNLYVPGCDEHYLAHEIRKHPDFIPELSLVVENENGKLIGSLMYTKASLTEESGAVKEILTFGPVAVEPVCQRRGCGKAMLEKSFDIAEKLGYEVIVIYGNPDNYIGRGFKSCMKYRVYSREGVFPAPMLVKELKEGALEGKKWVYRESPAFHIDMTGYEAFDSRHEQMIPGYQPSQEEFFIHSHSVVREEGMQ